MKHHETGHGRSLYKAAITAWGWESNLVWVCNIWAIQKTCQQAERYATTCPQESFAVFVASLLPGLCLAKAPEWLSSTSNGTSKIPTPQMSAGSKIICWANCRANAELTWGNSTKNVLVPFAWTNWFWDVWAAWEAARSQRILLWPSLAEAILRIPGNKPSCSRICAHWGSTMLQANTCSLLVGCTGCHQTSNGAMEDFGSDNTRVWTVSTAEVGLQIYGAVLKDYTWKTSLTQNLAFPGQLQLEVHTLVCSQVWQQPHLNLLEHSRIQHLSAYHSTRQCEVHLGSKLLFTMAIKIKGSPTFSKACVCCL